ncbi:MerR family transcriptional regulator [Bacillus cereus]|nr:MerR family transcriptional regulator [Bacillus cereus]
MYKKLQFHIEKEREVAVLEHRANSNVIEVEDNQYYSISQVASILDVSASTIRNWQQELGFYIGENRVGTSRMYTQEQVNKLRRIHDYKNNYRMPIAAIKKILEENFYEMNSGVSDGGFSTKDPKDQQIEEMKEEIGELKRAVTLMAQSMTSMKEDVQQVLSVNQNLLENSTKSVESDINLKEEIKESLVQLKDNQDKQAEKFQEGLQEQIEKFSSEQGNEIEKIFTRTHQQDSENFMKELTRMQKDTESIKQSMKHFEKQDSEPKGFLARLFGNK